MQHLEEGTIHAWLDGALPPAESTEVERHVAECSTCAAVVAEARGMIAGASRIVSSLDVVRGGVVPSGSRYAPPQSLWRSLRLTPARAALAATVMIAVASMLTVRQKSPVSSIVPRMVDSPPVRVTAAQPAVQAPPPSQAKATAGSASGAGAKIDAARPTDKVAHQESRDSRVTAPPVPAAAAAPALDRQSDTARIAQTSNIATADSAAAASRRIAISGFAPQRKEAMAALRDMAAGAPKALSHSLVCYRFIGDSASLPPAVPLRFALEEFAADTMQRVVRAVTTAGQVDSVLSGSQWTQPSPSQLVVRFSSTATPQLIMVRLAGNLDQRSGTLVVQRDDCRF